MTVPLQNLKNFVLSDLEKTNQVIKQLVTGAEDLIPLLANHLMGSGGKRLRPMLTLASTKLCNYTGNNHIYLAAAIEFIHAATLLHDDVIDGSDLRRGVPTANNKWGNKASILVGDFLLSQAFKLMVEAGSLRVLGILSNTSAVITEGEVVQLSHAHNIEMPIDRCIDIITAKTAVLFASACQIGAVIADRPEEELALREFGMNLGIAFQITDDILDYMAEEKKLGKTVGDDFFEGKVTLPAIIAYQQGSASERKFWQRTMVESEQKPEDLVQAITYLKKHGIMEKCMSIAKTHKDMALKAIEIFPECQAKSTLLEALAFSVERSY